MFTPSMLAQKNQELYNTIVGRQRELKERQRKLVDFNRTPIPSNRKFQDFERMERSVSDLKRAFSGHSKKLRQVTQGEVSRLYGNGNPNSALDPS
jgi:hypothetical protein